MTNKQSDGEDFLCVCLDAVWWMSASVSASERNQSAGDNEPLPNGDCHG